MKRLLLLLLLLLLTGSVAGIGKRAEITGDFTQEEAENLADVLNAGSLPAKIKKVSQRKVTTGDGGAR